MNEMQKIGNLIRDIRISKGLTQSQFAEILCTSQSAIARMEGGEQNISVEQLVKISDALEHPIIKVSANQYDDFRITGGHELSGSIETNPSKNGAMGLLCASLMNKKQTKLHGIPRIEEVNRLLEVFESIGVSARWIGDQSLEITTPEQFNMQGLDWNAAKRMRTTLMMIGPLSTRVSEFRIPHSGGCQMGERTIAAHRVGLEAVGIHITTLEDCYLIQTSDKHAADATMYEASDTGTENILMAMAGINDTSRLYFAQENYMVQDVMGFLRASGAILTRSGVSHITITGVSEVNIPIEYHNSEDPIESMAFITTAIVTRSKITITRCPIDFLRLEIMKLEMMGQKFILSDQDFSYNGFTLLVDITVIPSSLKALHDKIHPLPYPGINVDNLPFFVPICTMAEGNTLINDWMWENRAIYFTELNRLGANITLLDQHRVMISGATDLKANQIVCPPALRPSVIIMLAMLGAKGTSTLRNVYAIRRGYENIDKRLNLLGAEIECISSII